MRILSILFGLTLVLAACGEEAEQPASESSSDEEAKDKVAQAQQPDKSDLSLFMIMMESHMKAMSEAMDKGTGDLPSAMEMEHILTSKASDHVEYDSAYRAYVDDFMSKYSALHQESATIEEFNLVVSSCVDCHEEKCPGPIMRIEKLKK